MNAAPPRIEPVYLPHNEPYLGQPHLRMFDELIPGALDTNLEVSKRTFAKPLSPLQIAATEIIPQGVSIALSIRELIRQGYLFSAAILTRPLIERTGTIHYLAAHPDAVTAWRADWPRRAQPTLDELLSHMHPGLPPDTQEAFRNSLHKLVHSDPAGAAFNMFERHDGVPVFSCGKMVDQPFMCNIISIAGYVYLNLLVGIAAKIFPELPASP
jgi:hypothetical protein